MSDTLTASLSKFKLGLDSQLSTILEWETSNTLLRTYFLNLFFSGGFKRMYSGSGSEYLTAIERECIIQEAED